MSKFGASGGGRGGCGISLGTKATQLHNIILLYFNISANLLKEKDGYVALEQTNNRSFVFKKTDKPADRSAQFFSKLQEMICGLTRHELIRSFDI